MATNHRAKLAAIRRFDQLIAYLRDEMGWPITRDSFEDVDDLFFDYTPEELGIDTKNAAKIQEIKRLRPLSTLQPWGVFFVKFEPKRLPVVALRRILSQVTLKKRASANSAERAAWSADDLLFISNYGEGEARQISLAHFSQSHTKNDLPTLKVLGWDNLDTPLHLDHVAEQLTQRLTWPDNEEDTETWGKQWRSAFTLGHREVITTSKKLSAELAKLARSIRNRINTVLTIETEDGPVYRLMAAFKEALIHDLDEDGFADMYAQTIAYGLLSARVADPSGGTSEDFTAAMPVTNPFLKELMESFLDVGGRKRKAGSTAGLDFDELGVSEVVELLNAANMKAVIRDFGDRNPQEDPVIHFYELFLKEYDAKKRKLRGVFYTPRPVVSFIVRSVDELLRTEFGLADGLADTTTWGEMAERIDDLEIPEGATPDQAFIQILDLATGTGTFLVEVIGLIHKTMTEKWQTENHNKKDIRQLWNDYVPKHLLPRLHGYELMMAPYAIAHMKIGLKLYETGYRFGSDERTRVYLTNAVEPAQDFSGTLTFTIPALAHEAEAVNSIKRNRRFTVVLGNPPYSKSMSMHPWSMALVGEFKKGLHEKKSDLTREEWKFLRFGFLNIQRANIGLLGIIINNAFLSAPTHKGIRRFLIEHSNPLQIVDLHGDSRKGEAAQDGTLDQNVFEIQQGVCVLIGGINPSIKKRHQLQKSDIFGNSKSKYSHLLKHSVSSMQLHAFKPSAPHFFFRPQTASTSSYSQWIPIPKIFVNSNTGIQTKNDALFTDISKTLLNDRMCDVLDNVVTNRESICNKYNLKDSAGWRVSKLDEVQFDEDALQPLLYKPFDHRFIYYNERTLGRARHSTMKHMLHSNLGLVATRQVTRLPFNHAFVSRSPIEEKTGSHDRTTQLFPLYIYPEPELLALREEKSHRHCAFSPEFTSRLSSILGLTICEHAADDSVTEITPEEVFFYIYSILYSPTYRGRFGQELMGDFPHIPLTRSLELFRNLARLGGDLATFHLMESSKLEDYITTIVNSGDFQVEKISYSDETVWIDKAKTRGFHGVPEEVWNFHIGGYQVCEKWLKDRQAKGGKNPRLGRVLTDEDINHYQKVVAALSETIRTMSKIDEVIDAHGGWPEAFRVEGKDVDLDDGDTRTSDIAKVAEDGSTYENGEGT